MIETKKQTKHISEGNYWDTSAGNYWDRNLNGTLPSAPKEIKTYNPYPLDKPFIEPTNWVYKIFNFFSKLFKTT